jgi:DNA-binding CsgD family transcriptional regulator
VETGTRERQRTDIVGREPEVAALADFLARDEAPKALVLAGGPGIGKTTLWEAGVELAGEHGLRVLSTRSSDAEAQFLFAALVDLLDDIDTSALEGLPAPQRHALEVALLRAEPEGAPPEPRAIAVGLLNVLRALAAREPLLIALDDVQWLDPASADALGFAARRLQGQPVSFLLTKRAGHSSDLERALGQGLERLEVGPLSLGAMRRFLSARLGLSLPRQLLRRLVETTQGNPLFALELGRTLAEHERLAIGEEMPVPDAVEDLLGTRVAGLPESARRLLLAVALSADLSPIQLAEIAGVGALDDAVETGVLNVERDRVRASHPLLAAAARKHSQPHERRELHLELARVVANEELHARHLALATELPDAELAATVAAASAAASTRGARREAVELADHALRLTPAEATERPERLLALAWDLILAGEVQQATDLLVPELDSLPSGAPRARACLILVDGVISSNDEVQRYLERALAESQDDPALRAAVLAELATNEAVTRVERIAQAEAWAEEALPAARLAGPDVERAALHALGWARSLRGQAIDDVCDRFGAASDAASYIVSSPHRVAGQRHVWRGELEQARAILGPLLAIADERGEAVSYALQRLHMCELELRAGKWEAAARLLDEWAVDTEEETLPWPMYERCRAVLAVGRGLPEEAERWAAEAIARSESRGDGWDLLESLRARGMAALLAHEPERAVESLRRVWEHVQREGVDEPGVFPVAPDLVEALVELDEQDEALTVTSRLGELSEQQEHPWGLVTAKRCGALTRIGDVTHRQIAASDLEESAAAYAELGLRFDQARSLRSLGRAARRVKKWSAARGALEQAAEIFDEIGSVGWAEEVRAELERVGGRRPQQHGELTPAEQRVVELAAEGASNKEIAQALFVSVHTVEAHLSHVYAKLGIRSRAQLGRRLSAQAEPAK